MRWVAVQLLGVIPVKSDNNTMYLVLDTQTNLSENQDRNLERELNRYQLLFYFFNKLNWLTPPSTQPLYRKSSPQAE